MNIVQQVTPDYFSGRFSGCIFIGPNGNPHFIEGILNSERGVNCKEVKSPRTVENTILPFDFFESFSFLAVPEIGWRMAEDGRVMAHLQRNNTSYTRGITLKNVHKFYAEHTEYMFSMGKIAKKDVELPSYLATLVAKPNHLSMQDGLYALNTGKVMAFSNGPHVAVIPESDSVYNIFCDRAHAANITPEGEISLLADCPDFDLEILQ